MRGKGLLVLNEIFLKCVKILLENIEWWGVLNVIVINYVFVEFVFYFFGFFDWIVVDVFCLGEGMFRKDLNVVKEWIEEFLLYC